MRQRYLQLARQQARLLVIGGIAGMIAGIASGFGVPFFVQHVFRGIFEAAPDSYALGRLIMVSALLPLVFLVRGIASYINQYFLQWTMQNMLQALRQQLFDKLQILPLAYFEKRQSGDLMAKLVGDTLQVQQAVHMVAREAFVQPFTLLAGLGYLGYLAVTQSQVGFLLLLILLMPVMILPLRAIGRRLQRRSRELQATLGELTDIMAENLRAVTEVRSFNLQQHEQERFRNKLSAYNRFAMKMAKYYHLTQPLMEMLAVVMVSLAFIYSYRQGVGFSSFAALGAALFFTIDAAKRMVKMVNEVQRNSGSFERIEQVLTAMDAIPETAQPRSLPHGPADIRFSNVCFAYDGNVDLPDLSVDDLTISAGSVVALVGPSGAGKSTFAKLLPRFYDPQRGDILLSGVPTRELLKHDLRQRIAFVPQAPVLFNGSVRDNLLLAKRDASDEQLQAALEAACASEFVNHLPHGIDAMIGENAVRLSGGQRQRIALARAFLKDAPLLILDEATSALDAESEEHIQQALGNLTVGRTVIIIAHRFATIRMASRILLFDKGTIRAQGDLTSLLSDPLFRKLYEMQLAPER